MLRIALRDAVAERGWISGRAARRLKPVIEFTYYDYRQDQSKPAPEVRPYK